MILSSGQHLSLIRNAPLIAIDLVVKNEKNQVLVGLRKNLPAANTWFVPGGRIQKGERIEDGFKRVTKDELGIDMAYNKNDIIGVFEHIYDENYYMESGISTHYVVIAIAVRTRVNLVGLPRKQHRDWAWLSEPGRFYGYDTHENVKPYFAIEMPMAQYQILAERRQKYDVLVWQAPVISLTAQAFLFQVALGSGYSSSARATAGFLGAITAVASVQLLTRHRHMEQLDSSALESFEEKNKVSGWSVIHGRKRTLGKGRFLARSSSFQWWRGLLCIFGILSFLIMCMNLFEGMDEALNAKVWLAGTGWFLW